MAAGKPTPGAAETPADAWESLKIERIFKQIIFCGGGCAENATDTFLTLWGGDHIDCLDDLAESALARSDIDRGDYPNGKISCGVGCRRARVAYLKSVE